MLVTLCRRNLLFASILAACAVPALRADTPPASQSDTQPASAPPQNWNFHVQNTDIVQGDFPFPARYSGPNSLSTGTQARETVTLDLFAGMRLWSGAEAHVDALTWQGYGLSKTFGIEAFPDGDAYKSGTEQPNVMFARLFLRQTIGFGGEQEGVPDAQLTLAGKQDVSRLTFTLGRFTPTDLFDTNSYANDPHKQFMNWAMVNNLAWDYAADTVGFTSGAAVELNQRHWAARMGWFEMSGVQNGNTAEDRFLEWPPRGASGIFPRSWQIDGELEGRYTLATHPGTIRFLSWLTYADMATYNAAADIVQGGGPGADFAQARSYRYKFGLGLNWEQEVTSNGLGIFSRLGWNDGREEAWAFTDASWSALMGLSLKGQSWSRPDDSVAVAGNISGISPQQQRFLEPGGTGILDGDGRLTYGWEKAIETYYDFQIWKTIHGAVDCQYVLDPAFNRDRGPVEILGFRLHWEY